MQPCEHTKLMNAIIGMCKKNVGWITVLCDSDLNYEVQIIEQSVNTSLSEVVKPDVITASNRQLHSIVFELKGGKTLKLDQLKRYEGLTANDLLRWITVFDRTNLEFDVCICDLAQNHELIKSVNNNKFPMLVFGSEFLVKEGKFKRAKQNEAFVEPISLKGKTQPLSYYPFSDEDSIPYIALHVIQALLSIIHKDIKQGKNIPKEMRAREHKKALMLKINDATKRFLAKEGVKETLGIIRQKEGIKITKNLDQFKKIAEKFIEELQTQTPLSGFHIL